MFIVTLGSLDTGGNPVNGSSSVEPGGVRMGDETLVAICVSSLVVLLAVVLLSVYLIRMCIKKYEERQSAKQWWREYSDKYR